MALYKFRIIIIITMVVIDSCAEDSRLWIGHAAVGY